MKKHSVNVLVLLFIFVTVFCGLSLADSDKIALFNNSKIFHLDKKTSARQFNALPESTPIALPSGTVLTKADISRLGKYASAMRKHKEKDLPVGLTQKPKKHGEQLRSLIDLKKALKGKDRDTVILPSGKRTTVGMLKLLVPQVEKEMGHRLDANLAKGKVVQVDEKADWREILQLPDNTILRAPDGHEITLIKLKKTLAGKTDRFKGGKKS